MMVSEFVALVSRIIHLSAQGLILLTITSLICGAISYRITRSVQNGLFLLIGGLVLLMVWVSVWQKGYTPEGVWVTVCLAVVGQRVYLRALQL